MNRRSLLLGFGATLAAPAVVRAESLMKIIVPKRDLIVIDPLPIEGGTVSLLRIRELLLPGLRRMMADYESIPTKWDKIFSDYPARLT